MRLRPFLVLVSVLAWTLASAGAVSADAVVINNGLAPPNPDNLIGDTSFEDDYIYVENVGCPPGWPEGDPEEPCPSPGDPTDVEVANGAAVWEIAVHESSSVKVSGGTVWTAVTGYGSSTTRITGGFLGTAPNHTVNAYDSSTIEMSGGTVKYSLKAYDSSHITMSGGTVTNSLTAHGSATITMTGGTVDSYYLRANESSNVTISGGTVDWLLAQGFSTVTVSGGTIRNELVADGAATITIVGQGFAVDGVHVPYGDLTALTGTLTGTLASGDPVDNAFFQGGGDHTGTIALAPAGDILVPALSSGGKLALAAALIGSVAMRRRRSRSRVAGRHHAYHTAVRR